MLNRAALALVLLLLAGLPAAAAAGPLPLGPSGLSEQRTVTEVAPGVRLETVVRGTRSLVDVFTVDVAFVRTRSEARALASELRAKDWPAVRTRRVSERAQDDRARGPLGYLVRAGAFATEAEAIALRDRLTAAGRPGGRAVFTGEDGGRTTGPWIVRALTVDPERFDGSLVPELGTEVVPGRELLTAIAGRTDAVATINGGYFVIGEADGTPGDLAGVSVVDGEVVSEAVAGRTSFLLPRTSGAGARVATVDTRSAVRADDGATRELDGLNRRPGLIRGCGGTGGDVPVEVAKHDFTCTDASELIAFTPRFGASTEPGVGAEAALDPDGRVLELRTARGGAIPSGGSVLSGTGEAAAWLATHAQVGRRVRSLIDVVADGAPLGLTNQTGVVNGGPRLLRDGREDIPALAEGFVWPEDPGFFYRFGVRRNPRTLAGVRRDGRIVLVTIEGRAPGVSVGASFTESAGVLRSLGARDAVNLDGGGSTGLTVGARLLTRPSDLAGERPIGDALILEP